MPFHCDSGRVILIDDRPRHESSVHRSCGGCGHFAYITKLAYRDELVAKCRRCNSSRATTRIAFDTTSLIIGWNLEDVGSAGKRAAVVRSGFGPQRGDLLVLAHASLALVKLHSFELPTYYLTAMFLGCII
jgi:hypothetical protein